MTGVQDLNARELTELLHPLDKASADHVVKAACEAGELIRYLAHATLPVRWEDALPEPAQLDNLVTNLRITVSHLPQVLRQVAMRLAQQRFHPLGLAADEVTPAGVTPDALAIYAEDGLLEAADALEAIAVQLREVGNRTARLYIPASTREE